ncbi:MAG TPA: CarD family transcriptional regulator [Methylovirgula sp.]|nr:CarD family transcriptional regulator [Methylovirgula sp.]
MPRKASAKTLKRAGAKTKQRKPARTARGRSTAARAAASTRLKKAVKPISTRKPTARPAKGRVKAAQVSRLKEKEAATAQVKVVKTPVTPRENHEIPAQKLASERRAHAEAVLALRARAAKPVSSEPKAAKKAPDTVSQPPVAQRSAPAAPAPAQKPEAKPAETGLAKPAPKPPVPPKHGFKPAEFIVYPAHGVGQILAIEEQEVAGFKLELFVISFAKDKMILKVPTPKTVSVGMRKLANADVVKQALNTLTGRARIKRTMWSRRAQEYEAKINSGDLVAIAEVVRDLYRSEAQPEQSYSERQLYEAALDRIAREIAVVQKLTETEALKLIDAQLQKGPRRGKAEEAEGEAEVGAEAEEGGIDEAA